MINKNSKAMSLLLFLCLAVGVSSAFGQTEKTLSSDFDVSGFVRETFRNQYRANWSMAYEYTHKELVSITDAKANTETSLWEVFFPSRLKRAGRTANVSVLLEKNGVPLALKEIEKARRGASAELESTGGETNETSGAEMETLRERGIYFDYEWNNLRLGTYLFLSLCRFDSAQRVTFDGRETVAMRFQDCKLPNSDENFAYLSKVEGKIWIDAADKMVVRLEARPKSAFDEKSAAPSTKEPAILFEQKKVGGSFWFPSFIKLVGIGNEMTFPKFDVNRSLKLFDFQKAQTEIKEVKIGAR